MEQARPPTDGASNIISLFKYWTSIHPSEGLPGRRDFDPTEIPQLLPKLWLVDAVGMPVRFRFRLVGTAITSFTGRDSTGKWLDEVYDDFPNTGACRRMKRCATTGEPLYQRGNIISNPDTEGLEAERIYLPLASDGRSDDIIAIMTIYLGERPINNTVMSLF